MFLRFPSPLRARTIRQRALGAAAGAAVVLAAAACSPAGSIESADVPAWKATALPSADGMVLEEAGKILNRDPIVKTTTGIGAGHLRSDHHLRRRRQGLLRGVPSTAPG